MIKTIINIEKDSWIDWVQLFLIGLTAPFFLFPSMKYVWVLFIVPGIWIWRLGMKKQFFNRTLLDWAIVVLLIQVFATCIVVPDLAFSLPKIAGVLLGVLFFYSIVALLISDKLIKWGILGFIGASLIFSIVSILGVQWASASSETHSKKMMTKIAENFPKINWNLPGAELGFNANAIGGTLILIIPLCFVIFFLFLKRRKKYHLISSKAIPLISIFVTTSVLCIVLFLTQSIGSWIGLIISIWILLLSWKWRMWSLVILFLLIVITFSSHNEKTVVNIIKTKVDVRKEAWSGAIDKIGEQPVFGIGMNSFRQIPDFKDYRVHAHNHFLHTAAELGISGLIAYLAMLIGTGYMCYEIWKVSNVGWMKISALGVVCGQLAHLIFGMMDSIPLGAKVGFFFWFSLALITAMYNYMIRKNVGKYRGRN